MKYFLILLILYSVQCNDITKCYSICGQISNCWNSVQCKKQIYKCESECQNYDNPFHEFGCFQDCLQEKFSVKAIDEKTIIFMNCYADCLDGDLEAVYGMQSSQTEEPAQEIPAEPKETPAEPNETLTKPKETPAESNETPKKPTQIQKLKDKVANDPFSHPGTTFKEIDCQAVKKKWNVILRKGNQHKVVSQYFESRCDVNILSQQYIESTEFDFKWTDYHHQQDFKNFKPGQQVINHIPNIRSLLSDKDGFYKTLVEFDKKQLYDFNSTQFHFKSHIFDLKSSTYNEEEQNFMDNVNTGYWLAKDPDGSLGLGITLFRGTQEIKQNIEIIKGSIGVDKTEREIAKFSVIQKYLDNPLLTNKKKFDLRIYIIIVSVDPFVVLYQLGFIRKCIVDYDLDFKRFDKKQAYKHLTNRIYQQNHPQYEQYKQDLMLTPQQYEDIMRNEIGLSEKQFKESNERIKKIVGYAIESAREKLITQKGMFQFLGGDIIFDDQLQPWLIEINTSAGLYTKLLAHQYVIPQLAQSTMDLILDTYQDQEKLWKIWAQDAKGIDLGRWEFIYNEASGFDILKSHRLNKNKHDDL